MVQPLLEVRLEVYVNINVNVVAIQCVIDFVRVRVFVHGNRNLSRKIRALAHVNALIR